MNFRDLRESVLNDLFPEGRAENLEVPHQKQIVQALADLQNAVPCLRYANNDHFPQCSTYFNCGLTVLPQPAGQVLRVYTIGRLKTDGVSAGTSVGSTSVSATLVSLVNNSIVVSDPTTGKVCDISTDGVYTVSVNQTNPASAFYPANSPQYFRTEITYTDLDGNLQTVQPADLIHVNESSKSGAMSISCKGGTSVDYVITPTNAPITDGGIGVEISVVTGPLEVDADDWCSKVYYDQVEYAHIEKYVRACNNCQSSVWQVANAMAAYFFGSWRSKRRYNPPTDAGLENLPKLPHGFHYPQASTNAGGRSPRGVYAIKHGRIYIAPWVESSESVVVEWNGVKNNWGDADLVSEDPLFIKAVRLNVAIQHYTHYEDNVQRLNEFKKQYFGEPGAPGVLRELIVQCRNRNRVRSDAEIGVTAGDSAVGTGIIGGGITGSLFYNTAQSYTATCPSGQSGNPVPVTIPAGQFSSALSQSDANAQALAAATSQAQAALSCSSVGMFVNVEVTKTADCPAASGDTPRADGSSASATIPAGTYQASTQAIADATAEAAALAQAQSQLSCTFHNAPQTVEVDCQDGTTQSATVAASDPECDSTTSQFDADNKAKIKAQNIAVGYCATPPGAYTVGNTRVIVPYALRIVTSCGLVFPVTGTITVEANTYTGQANASTEARVIANLNQHARDIANTQVESTRALWQATFEVRCRTIGHGGFL